MILVWLVAFAVSEINVQTDTLCVKANTGSDFPALLMGIRDYPGAAGEYLRQKDTVKAALCYLMASDTAACLQLLQGCQQPGAARLRAAIFLAQGRMVSAFDEIDRMPLGKARDSTLVYAYISIMDFPAGKEAAHGDSGLLKAVEFAGQTAPLLYDENTASKLSWFPGLGQAYADAPGQGVKAAAVNASVVAAMIISGAKHHWLDLFFIYSFFFNRFYPGARANAVALCRDKNKTLLENWLKQLRRETGLNPFYWEEP